MTQIQSTQTETTLEVTIPGLKLIPGDNAREHWASKARRAKRQRGVARMVLHSQFGKAPELPLTVTITRIGKRRLDKGDNLNSSAKHVRDGIADWVGVDDGDDRYTWHYNQAPGDYGVTIRIEATR